MTGDDQRDESTQSAPDAPPSKGDVLRTAVDLAGHAPSLYNAQPWSWEISDERADLFLDVTQSFPVADPDLREARIGCGAALHHLQVAVTAAGWGHESQLSSGLQDRLLAQVRLTDPIDADPAALRLVQAIALRHNDRRPFSTELISAEVLGALQTSVDEGGVHLQIVSHDEHRIWLSVLAERAALLQSAREGYSEELARVTGTDGDSTILADEIPHVVSPRHTDVTLRDFELLAPGTLGIPESAEEHPVWCVLWTDDDGPLDWLEAGRGLSRLLLDAASRGLATGIQSQPVEVAMIRAQINEHLLSGLGHAQVLVRIGWPGTPNVPAGVDAQQG